MGGFWGLGKIDQTQKVEENDFIKKKTTRCREEDQSVMVGSTRDMIIQRSHNIQGKVNLGDLLG